jgi:hypothetical protein
VDEALKNFNILTEQNASLGSSNIQQFKLKCIFRIGLITMVHLKLNYKVEIVVMIKLNLLIINQI